MVAENGVLRESWQDIAARKCKIRDQAIDDFLQRYSDPGQLVSGVDICDLEHDKLRELLARGAVQAEKVTIAYIYK